MDYNKIAAYTLSVALLGLSIYLHSPLVAIASVALFAFHYAHEVLLKVQENKDVADLKALIHQINQLRTIDNARLDQVEKDLATALVRVRETLGESF
jgi:hypothetical protein